MTRPHFFKSVALILLTLFSTCLAAFAAEPLENSNPDDSSPKPLAEYYQSGEIKLPAEFADARQITIAEAIDVALRENLELQAATYSARAAAAAHKGAYGLYDPVLAAEYFAGEQKDLLNLSFFSSPTENDYSQAAVSLLQKLPIGTELTLSVTQLEEDALPAPSINPSYDTVAELSLLQPLLKGFGPTVTNRRIIFASSDKQVAIQDLRARAFAVVAAVRDAYFETLQAQYELSYRETSVELARRIVRENRARVEAGILPPVERLEAEVGLQTRERFLLDAQRAFADALDRFNLLINAGDVVNLPSMEPFDMSFAPVASDGIKAGLLNRPDVLKRISQIDKLRQQRSIAKNALLPELNLVASYNVNGLDDNSSDSIQSAQDAEYDGWEIGVRFSYPLGSIESRNELKRSKVALLQEQTLLSQLHNEVRNDVRAAIRNIDVSRKKTEVAARGHKLAREKLRILMKSREVGLATTRDVLDGEEDLASARTEQIAAIADYFKAVTEYLRVSGTLLASEGIVFEGDVTPDLQRIPFYLR